VETARLYRLEGAWAPKDADRIASALLADPVIETFRVRKGAPPQAPSSAVDVWYKPQVTDPAAESVAKAIQELGLDEPRRVRCGQRCSVSKLSRKDLEKLVSKVLANETVHEWQIS
jgi:phosphoribosylformylglycinamidine (FGAM) synthase PurS component